MPRISTLFPRLLVASLIPTALFFPAAATAKAASTSTTTLTVTAGGKAVTTATVGTVITLAASVVSSPANTQGLVNFCDGTPCTGTHFLGSVQISDGLSILRLRPSIGVKKYYATFTGTASVPPSTSATATLTVSGGPTTTAISAAGTANGYALKATVTGSGSAITPSGNVSFLNTSNGNAVLDTAGLATTGTVNQTFTQSTYSLLSPLNMVFADFNGDGILDVAATNEGNASLSISLGNGDGTFRNPTYYDITAFGGFTGNTISLASGDFNRDGKLDLIMTGNGDVGSGLFIYFGNGDGTFQNPVFIAQGGQVDSVAVGDFNGDGIQDLAVTSDMSNQVQLYIGRPDGTFTSGNILTTDSGPSGIVAADINGDGRIDLVVSNTVSGSVNVYPGNGDGSFKSRQTYTLAGPTYAPYLADLNNDGALDLIAVSSASTVNGNFMYVFLNKNTGDGTFQAPATYPLTSFAQYAIASDINGDGIPDLIASALNANTISVFPGVGDGTFGKATVYTVGYQPGYIAAADLNGDGVPDIITPSAGTDTLTILLNQLTSTTSATATGITVTGPPTTYAADAKYPGDTYYLSSTSTTTTLTAASPTIALYPPTLPSGIKYVAYSSTTITATGGSGPYSFGVTAGTLPAGLSLTGAGVLSGTPTNSGLFPVTITGTDTNGYTGTINYVITIAAPTITLQPATLPGGTTYAVYNATTLSATGGTAPYTFAVTTGALPVGLTLTGAGVLSGTPTKSGMFPITVTTTDVHGDTGTINYAITIAPPTITLQPATLPGGTTYAVYTATTLTATGGATPYTFAVTTGALPAGLSLTNAGTLSGTPTTSGVFPITVTGTDTNGYTGSIRFTITIAPPTITLSPVTLLNDHFGVTYSQPITASGGLGSYTFAVTGTLPPGLTLSTEGILSGTPTASGSFSFTVTATDSSATPGPYSGSAPYTITIAPADFTFTLTGPAGYSAAPGSTATYSFSLSPLYVVYGGTVTFTVDNLPAGATATFTPSIVTTSAGAANVTMSVQTPAAIAHNRLSRTTALLALVCIPLLFIKRKTRDLRSIRALVLLLTIAGIMTSLSGCGSNNGFLLQAVQEHTLTVTASNGTTQHSQQVLLVIQ